MRHTLRVALPVLGMLLVAFLYWTGSGLGNAGPFPADREPQALPTGTLPFHLPPFQPSLSQPAATPASPSRLANNPLVWIGGEGSLTMLSPEGWKSFALQDIVRDIAIDQQGNAILAPGLRMCDGRLLRELLPRAPGGEQDAVAVDPQGRIWTGYYGGIAVLADGRWQVIPIGGSDLPDKARMVRDLAIDSQGVVWLATGAGLSRYDGRSWQNYTQDLGLGASQAYCVMVDQQDRVWVAHEKGLSMLQGTRWGRFFDTLPFVRGLVALPSGHILAGSLYYGLSVFDGQVWTTWAGTADGLPSDRITALAMDQQGRVWAGTRFGLSVLDGQRWIAYQEATTGLGDNHVTALAVAGALETLPTPEPERYGHLRGQVTLGREPVAGVAVLLCAELSLAEGFADNPCQGMPFSRVTYTGADGQYLFENVPVGHYAVAAEVEPGRWVTRTRVLSAVRYVVRAGEVTVAETIEGGE